MKTILTGIRVNGEMTLGNFLGALLPMVRLANAHAKDYNINIFVPDLHTIISDVEGNIAENTKKSLKYFLAAGLTPSENLHFYRQSRVPAHSELCWILDCVASVGELSRMTQYKEKGNNQPSVNVGIFNYPVLMAADILLYSATFVPVGEDQFQHLELARNLALRFNNKYGEVFTLPATGKDQVAFMGEDTAVRIRDLIHPEKKMSKSALADNSKILMSDSPERAEKKILSATTDSLSRINFDFFNQPGISNLLVIDSLLTNLPLHDIIGTWAGETHYGDLKKSVASHLSAFLSDFQSKLESIPDSLIDDLLEQGEAYANSVANSKLLEVQKAIGLR
ncbi:tryptophan--tRNA ligase [Candidatus Saccharibacteria bacterium]|nr:tryptophan--tRNA ligase [Candidatus Saccharibacteria bacterium]